MMIFTMCALYNMCSVPRVCCTKCDLLLLMFCTTLSFFLCFRLQPQAVCLRAPVSESLSRLGRDQLQKFAQYLISELPQQVPAIAH